MFILTTDKFSNPKSPASHPYRITVASYCGVPASGTEEIQASLIEKDGMAEADAEYLARISGGNYASTRFYDAKTPCGRIAGRSSSSCEWPTPRMPVRSCRWQAAGRPAFFNRAAYCDV